MTDPLSTLLSRVAAEAPDLPLRFVRELLSVGERKVALEILCDNLADLEITLSPETRRALAARCQDLGVAPGYVSESIDGPP
ncbi:MAG: MafI family immunity protein [Alphaproteobacteria bacterium]|nr:MafI family immunity protein [Alphaproteobacteria bacterium]